MLTQKQIHIITVFPLFFSEITPRANNAVRTDTKIFIFNLQILIYANLNCGLLSSIIMFLIRSPALR